MKDIYTCPGCGRKTDDYETYSYCIEYHCDHPDTVTTPKEWDSHFNKKKRI